MVIQGQVSQASNPVVGSFPLSPQQRRLWLLPGDPAGRRARCTVGLSGRLDPEALRRAVFAVAAREEILRTVFRCRAGMRVPFQVVLERLDPAWEVLDLSRLGPGAQEAEVSRLAREQAAAPVDLARGPVLAATLVRLAPESHGLLLALPALSGDARSLDNLVREVARVYATGNAGEPALPYADFTAWQDELRSATDEDAAQARAFWKKQRTAAAEPLTLPGARAGEGGSGPGEAVLDLPRGLAAGVTALAEELRVPLAALFLAAWKTVLFRLTGASELVVGEVFGGRRHEELLGGLGPYARCLPLRSLPRGGQPFTELLTRLEAAREQAQRWQEHADLEAAAGSDGALGFALGFEYEELPEPVGGGGVTFSVADREVALEVFEAGLACRRAGDRLRLALRYDAGRLAAPAARLLLERLAIALQGIVGDPQTALGDLDVLTPGERQRVLVELNDARLETPAYGGIHELFEEQARRHPHRDAVVCGERHLTYAELDRQAGALARRLRALGIGPEDRVALFLERSPVLIAGLLGILKAGGAYVPLDPVFPRRRLAGMVEDAGVRAIVTEERLAGLLPEAGVPRVLVGAEDADDAGDVGAPPPADAQRLAYVLFTSGSTGRPKPVGIEHRSLLNYLAAIRHRLEPPAEAGFATVSTFAADLGNTMVFAALCGGGCLHVVAPETASDPAAFAAYMRRHAIDCLKIVPSHLAALLLSPEARDILPRRLLVLGGEATRWKLVETVEALAPECRLFNHYGPTETTIGATAQAAGAVLDRAVPATLPIGRPLANYRAYLVDAGLRPVPPGDGGELLLGGAGLARGYLGRPELTARRFLPDPFGGSPGGRVYRTGDLARLLPDGSIVFLGRVDHQVKIRGFRVELGEIEAALGRHPGVWEAAAVLREDVPEEAHLVAYVVPRRGRTLDPAELRAELAEALPEYMLPAAVVVLKALPLTPNGKVDLRALPAPERSSPGERAVGPRTPAERTLAAVWSEVLGIPKVSVEANFFELGGDSILAIQVAARAHREGFLLNPKQIFEHQTIARLAAVAVEAPRVQAEQGMETGPVPLTPIQRWFFAQGFTDPHHWNQSLLMEVREPLPAPAFARLVATLAAHHDALRLRFAAGGEGREWRQWIAGPEAVAGCAAVVDLSALPAGRRSAEIEAAAVRVQASLDLERGPIARFVLFDCGPGEPDRLLGVVHHLAVDGVSWRILIEGLQEGWQRLARGEAPALPPKTSSVKQWAERLADHARTEALEAELPAWLDLAAEGRSGSLPRDLDGGDDTLAAARSVSVALDAERTHGLLKELPAAYGTEINDALLTALARGFARWTGNAELWVDLEGHGREPLFDDVDLSRTVGWFTTHFPVRLDADPGARPGETLLEVKERLRRVPGRGIGFGVLRELGREEVAAPLRALPLPEVKFNYLGQLDRAVADAGPFGAPRESAGPDRSRRAVRPHLLEINGGVVGGCLNLWWTYSERRHRRETIETLAGNVLQELAALVDQGRGTETYSVSDFPLARLDEERLARLLAAVADGAEGAAEGGRRRIEDVYPVSPLQESLLVHALASGGSGAGFEQKSTTLEGELDLDAFVRTWQEVVARHPILRTSFYWDGAGAPLQVVWAAAPVPVEQLDWSGLTPEKQRIELQGLLRAEREHGFDPGRVPLLRLVIVRLGESHHQLVWSYHHLLLDAWCRNLLLREVFLAYDAFRRGREPGLPDCRPYRDYIGWLAGRDAETARTFWRTYLKGFLSPTPLPGRPAGRGGVEHRWMRLSTAATEALEAFGRRHQVTLGTLVQGAWALLLGRYAERGDVVFGATVAGRPAELPGVESILGMFVNNVPVRARFTGEEPAGDWLRGFQESLAGLREHEWVSPAAIQEASELPPGQRLFESLLVVQNYPADDAAAEGGGGDLRVTAVTSRLETGYPLTVVAGPLRPLSARLFFDARRLDAVTAAHLGRQLGTLLQAVAADAGRRLGDLPLLAEAERHQVLVEWNDAPGAASDRLPALETEAAAVTDLAGETELPSELLPTLVERHGATAMQAPPPLWGRWLAQGFRPPAGFTAVCVGAGLSPALARELASGGGSVVQVYALADGGRWLSARPVRPGDPLEGPSLIGPPLEGAELHVLSPDGQPVPVGVTGHVFAGGRAAAPSGLVPTGDLARRRTDGRIELLGRPEERTALAGGTVDPGAVELELLRHPTVLGARVVPWQDAVGELHLVAYIVADRLALPRIEDLSAMLLRRLPRYAVPDLYVRLEALPVAGDGRVDLLALPAPDQAVSQLETPYVAPCDPLEHQLKVIWEDLLGIRPIGIRDDFFALGGSSLLAVRMIDRIRAQLGRDLPLATLLRAGTVELLAQAVRSHTGPAPGSPLVELQAGSRSRPPLFCVHAMGGEVLCYAELARCLGPDQPFYGLQARSWAEPEAETPRSIEEMAATYLAAVREVRPAGPYHLAGWSLGGIIALEMAQQLHAAGEAVALLAILDTNLLARGGAVDEAEFVFRFARRHPSISVEHMRTLESIDERLAYAIETATREGFLPPGLDLATAIHYARAGEANSRAKEGYVPGPYPGRITLLRAVSGHVEASPEPTLGWGPLALGGLEILDVPGSHNVLMEKPYVQAVARQLRGCLDRAAPVLAAGDGLL